MPDVLQFQNAKGEWENTPATDDDMMLLLRASAVRILTSISYPMGTVRIAGTTYRIQKPAPYRVRVNEGNWNDVQTVPPWAVLGLDSGNHYVEGVINNSIMRYTKNV